MEVPNIIIRNSGGSPVDKISDTIPTNYMRDCSHHLDLRTPNIYDP